MVLDKAPALSPWAAPCSASWPPCTEHLSPPPLSAVKPLPSSLSTTNGWLQGGCLDSGLQCSECSLLDRAGWDLDHTTWCCRPGRKDLSAALNRGGHPVSTRRGATAETQIFRGSLKDRRKPPVLHLPGDPCVFFRERQAGRSPPCTACGSQS